ncbi:ATP-dependent Lon protease [Leptospira wolffii]|uniref:ATP-dependent Lon protease n=1 Tax=Leptospira wolffii TaxID=409998 RepID=A0A2M9Z9S0_9LEPT|nr:LON peptidase substrate-binding domain-containing protein [Leptospira wolffii]EPG67208.1 ATP-dependent protease La (LON) domain protein [Leptospira wolffii serovar Khorat str. Khorat-H2]PJZ65150.1 ATP-dependent Lon protease [Leptospira wolffii]TGK56725.1 ATP-dependent Lon protease [Leptospira wolffii]TGK71693.1 ATP-dependent Lon protease [Leptospira wolffii]TGK75450.1 ATP-dependent Lon protease [Leptospira wolffii]
MSRTTIPIFPLPEVILFPGTFLPLHIFEPRYRMMLDYCYESGEELAVAPFKASAHGSDAHPEIENIFGWGQIVRREPLPDGRSNILLEGKGIAKLQEYQTMEPFRIGMVDKIDPDERYLDNLEFQETFDRILYFTKRILLTEGANEELILRMNDLWSHPFPVDFISSILNFNLQKKQEILSNPDQIFKAKVLVEIVEKMNLAE